MARGTRGRGTGGRGRGKGSGQIQEAAGNVSADGNDGHHSLADEVDAKANTSPNRVCSRPDTPSTQKPLAKRRKGPLTTAPCVPHPEYDEEDMPDVASVEDGDFDDNGEEEIAAKRDAQSDDSGFNEVDDKDDELEYADEAAVIVESPDNSVSQVSTAAQKLEKENTTKPITKKAWQRRNENELATVRSRKPLVAGNIPSSSWISVSDILLSAGSNGFGRKVDLTLQNADMQKFLRLAIQIIKRYLGFGCRSLHGNLSSDNAMSMVAPLSPRGLQDYAYHSLLEAANELHYNTPVPHLNTLVSPKSLLLPLHYHPVHAPTQLLLMLTWASRRKSINQTPTRPPMMGDGDVDASLLWKWFNKCENFFRHKSTAAENKVVSVAFGMSGVHAIRWLSANAPNLESMAWDDYKACMCNLFLPSDWEHSTWMDVLWIQQRSKSFVEFSLEMMGKNNLLAGTDSFLNDELLRDTLEANMDRELARECNRENLISVSSFRDWLDEVRRLDERKKQRLEEIACEFGRLNAKAPVAPHINFHPLIPSKNIASSSPGTTSFVPIPKLLDEERALLSSNGGCYKCRRFWAGHVRARCTAPPINGSKYKTLTAKDVPPRPANYSSRGGTSSVATVVPDVSTASLIDINDATVVEMPPVVAAIR
ncbi:hypothetical protein BDN71DRAFT_1437076 [Pleurotus eryngii]|uniref:Uncharacterized protein n=1 Tax=Pleurotus eryngii TaxID=5323 RepID=A0A9P5ZHA0_PLEER|nr:hypothetical protein BDN71DRAFT_1437076 [Pleurotus eryngii]